MAPTSGTTDATGNTAEILIAVAVGIVVLAVLVVAVYYFFFAGAAKAAAVSPTAGSGVVDLSRSSTTPNFRTGSAWFSSGADASMPTVKQFNRASTEFKMYNSAQTP